MSYIKIFISYCKEDKSKMEFIKNLIDIKPQLKSLVVPQENSDLDYNPEKIKKAFAKTTVFLPILTSNSIKSQWVNQEIGYCFALNSIKIEDIKPLVEKNTANKLKGFISISNDLNYRFTNDEDFENIADKPNL